MKKYVVLFSLGLMVFAGAGQAFAADVAANSSRPAGRLWAQIPFVEAGDLGQYQSTMAQGRDGTRRVLWQELMNEVQSLAEKGTPAELVLEPMAKILLAFNDMYDLHKSRDVVKVDLSLESQFKAQFDNLFREFDIRDNERNVELAEGSVRFSVDEHLKQYKTGNKTKSAQEIYNLLDYMAYGTFSNLGRGQFQLTLHLTSLKNNGQRAFVAKGRLTEAVGSLALQVFDYFQKNQYVNWETPFDALEWIPSPVNPGNPQYSAAEALQYCKLRGYRLPYAREILMAASGTQYKPGGINILYTNVNYAVMDLRETRNAHWVKLANTNATGGPISSDPSTTGSFWCVRGKATPAVSFIEKVWELIRAKRATNLEVYRALETVRLDVGDFGAKEEFFAVANGTPVQTSVYSSMQEALRILQKHGIKLEVPKEVIR